MMFRFITVVTTLILVNSVTGHSVQPVSLENDLVCSQEIVPTIIPEAPVSLSTDLPQEIVPTTFPVPPVFSSKHNPIVILPVGPAPVSFGHHAPGVHDHESVYKINYFEKPWVIKNTQSAALHVFTQTPVVVDEYAALAFNELAAPSAVIVEEVCGAPAAPIAVAPAPIAAPVAFAPAPWAAPAPIALAPAPCYTPPPTVLVEEVCSAPLPPIDIAPSSTDVAPALVAPAFTI